MRISPAPFAARQLNGLWRSLVARLHGVQEAVGSNPASPTINERWFISHVSLHQETLQLTDEELVGENAKSAYRAKASAKPHTGMDRRSAFEAARVRMPETSQRSGNVTKF